LFLLYLVSNKFYEMGHLIIGRGSKVDALFQKEGDESSHTLFVGGERTVVDAFTILFASKCVGAPAFLAIAFIASSIATGIAGFAFHIPTRILHTTNFGARLDH
jgi:hypothetical protein